ncbi:hypothetical protein COI93_18740, partial [Bacillus cereus]
DVGAPDREALFASSEGAKRPEILAARAGLCFRRILRWEYYCPLMRDKYVSISITVKVRILHFQLKEG